MRKMADRLLGAAVGALCLLSVLILAFMVFFIVRESLPAIREVGLRDLLLGDQWRPIIYRDAPSYGLRNMILSTLYVSVLAVALALVLGVGCALFLACAATERQRALVMPCIDLLAGIPSVVYGFVGLYIVIRAIEACGHKVLALPSPDGKISAAQIRSLCRSHYADESFEHTVQPGMVYLSFSTESGLLYSKAELEDIAAACKEYHLPLCSWTAHGWATA